MALRLCLAGATGWAGGALARAVARSEDIELVAGVSRNHAGKSLGDVLGVPGLNLILSDSAREALKDECDVFFEYTKPDVAKENVAEAIRRRVNVVIGTSGLSDRDFVEIDEMAQKDQVGVLAVGNFAITNVLMQKCAEIAAKFIPHWEIIDYADDKKIDVPSGTVRELSHRLSKIQSPNLQVPIEQVHGPKESRGASINGMQVHSIRLPGYIISAEIIFGLPDQKLILRYEAGSSPEPYVAGAMLAIRKVGTFVGLKRGLDSVIEF